MNKLIAIFASIFLANYCIAQVDSVQTRLVLIGDAGQFTADGKQPVINSVKKIIKLDSKTTVLYLGDNLYTFGLPDEQHVKFEEAKSILYAQVRIADGTGAQVYMIPGNHDWARNGPGGWEAIRRQMHYVNIVGLKNVHFYPEEGCPGPVARNIGNDVVMILLDSEWWIHQYEKPGIESDCPYKTQTEVLSELQELITENAKKLVIIATHHPFKSYGIHGGYFTWKQHIFPLTEMKKNLYVPLPIVGSVYPIARGVFGTPQDLKHPAYQNMVHDIQNVVKSHPNVVFVAGHEHTMQLIKDSSYHYIVSGAGSRQTRVSKGKNALYVSDTMGYAVMEVSKNKTVHVDFYNVNGDHTAKRYSNDLFNFSKLPLEDSTKAVVSITPYEKDSITVAANPRLAKASALKRFLNGDNYRDEWGTPVTLPVFRLKKMGLTPQSIGGGKQTKSLRLIDKNKKEWVLRTMDKEVSSLVPGGLTGSAAEDYLKDYVSTAHPYAPVIVPVLAKAAKILSATPVVYYVPNDADFGAFRQWFANKICTLEEREPVPDPTNKTRSTAKVLNQLIDENDHHVDQRAVLRTRLLDILIADWDRHPDQWRFLIGDTGKGKLYIPIPRDRDQALSYSDGLVMKVVQNQYPFLKGFRKDIPKVKWLSYWARDFDRLFLNNLEQEDWQEIIAAFQRDISDEVIHKAVMKLPKEIYALKGKLIEEKLRNRRDLLTTEGIKYYKFLSKEVSVPGSNMQEFFKVSRAGDKIQVRVYTRKEMDTTSVMFDRKFDENETREIRLYGLANNDYFNIDADATSKMRIRIIGGRGSDTFDVRGNVQAYVYDLDTANENYNYMISGKNVKSISSHDPAVNQYSPIGFQYDRFKFPNIAVGFNAEDGLLAGVGLTFKTYSFRKQPFSTFQKLNALAAFKHGSYQVNYKGQFNKVLGNNDLIVNGDLVRPTLNNFFGLGNETKVDPAKGLSYYRVRYNYLQADLLVGRRPNGILTVGIGPTFYQYWNNLTDNADKILHRPSDVGLDSANVYADKSYAGGKFLAIINNLNNESFPTRGVYWVTQFSALGGLNGASKPLTYYTSDMTVYSSFAEPANFMTVLRIGGGRIFSKHYEYFQAMNIGQNNYLRGFRKNRFSGSGMFYTSLEMRQKLLQSNSYLFPGAVGLIGFTDVGRVWVRDEQSKKWHASYGGGLYYSAYNSVLLSATVGFSGEETLFNFTLGTKFNLTF
jgi:hypothetical protein